MIKILKKLKDKPYLKFYEYYKEAINVDQSHIESIAISSYCSLTKTVNSRFVNLKYIDSNRWTFFTNYNSSKAIEFEKHKQISALFYWSKINLQIRIKADIKKSDEIFSDNHFKSRSIEKNALAISSKQSEEISSYDLVKKNYYNSLNKGNLDKRPEYWGGYDFIPYSFEFWTGENNRLNKRELFIFHDNLWRESFLQP